MKRWPKRKAAPLEKININIKTDGETIVVSVSSKKNWLEFNCTPQQARGFARGFEECAQIVEFNMAEERNEVSEPSDTGEEEIVVNHGGRE